MLAPPLWYWSALGTAGPLLTAALNPAAAEPPADSYGALSHLIFHLASWGSAASSKSLPLPAYRRPAAGRRGSPCPASTAAAMAAPQGSSAPRRHRTTICRGSASGLCATCAPEPLALAAPAVATHISGLAGRTWEALLPAPAPPLPLLTAAPGAAIVSPPLASTPPAGLPNSWVNPWTAVGSSDPSGKRGTGPSARP